MSEKEPFNSLCFRCIKLKPIYEEGCPINQTENNIKNRTICSAFKPKVKKEPLKKKTGMCECGHEYFYHLGWTGKCTQCDCPEHSDWRDFKKNKKEPSDEEYDLFIFSGDRDIALEMNKQLIDEFQQRFQINCPECGDWKNIKITMNGNADVIWIECNKCKIKFTFSFIDKQRREH